MSDEKYSFTFNFNAPVGQNIAHVDHLEAHFDKDMSMQVVGNLAASTTHEAHTTPFENDYVAVVEWLEEEKRRGTDWYKLNNNNRTAMCRQLSQQFGWTVDQNSLGKAQKRTN